MMAPVTGITFTENSLSLSLWTLTLRGRRSKVARSSGALGQDKGRRSDRLADQQGTASLLHPPSNPWLS